ncbi:hypothetical protein J3R83DRAFT_3838 [Lanmaoa asiatica]|nr:hypothetical protein J3R83DRAFT_3838 [Lanmaoa asiatica]
MLKSRTLAYDGRGNFVVRTLDQATEALQALTRSRTVHYTLRSGSPSSRKLRLCSYVLLTETWFPIPPSRPSTRITSDTSSSLPCGATILLYLPVRSALPSLPFRHSKALVSFVSRCSSWKMGTIYINENAPRPHNSGHYTIEACHTSQYENHLRAILGLPLGSTALKVPSAVMLNIIAGSTSMNPIQAFTNTALTIPGYTIHLYGKSECRPGRKMGHITLVADTDANMRAPLRPLLPIPSTQAEIDAYAPPLPDSGSGHPITHPIVGIVMGSDSDLPTLLPAARVLDHFHIPYELTIVSAHRTPDRCGGISSGDGSGDDQHPGGGFPVKGSALDGVDSLYSIVQMPRGIPVATVAINGGMNAGLLAMRILGAGIPNLFTAMEEYLGGLEKGVLGKVDKLADVGWESYEVNGSWGFAPPNMICVLPSPLFRHSIQSKSRSNEQKVIPSPSYFTPALPTLPVLPPLSSSVRARLPSCLAPTPPPMPSHNLLVVSANNTSGASNIQTRPRDRVWALACDMISGSRVLNAEYVKVCKKKSEMRQVANDPPPIDPFPNSQNLPPRALRFRRLILAAANGNIPSSSNWSKVVLRLSASRLQVHALY